jgi:hypothetical protein
MMERQTARSLPRMGSGSRSTKAPIAAAPRRQPHRTADNRGLSLRVAVQRGYASHAAAFLSCALGCGTVTSTAAGTQRYEADVRVESDPSKPLAAVGILQGAHELGRTSKDGTVRVALSGKNGDVVTLQVACPEGFAPVDKPLSVVLRPLVGASVVPQYRARCEPLTRSLVVAVRAKGGPNLAVKHLGREIARTDAEGAAHALLKVSPAEQVTLVLDTTCAGCDRLRPSSPELSLLMPARDEVAVFDQTFTEQVPPVVKRKPQAPKVLGPVKIEAPARFQLR